jgi:hypothetical protein
MAKNDQLRMLGNFNVVVIQSDARIKYKLAEHAHKLLVRQLDLCI